MSWLTPLEIPIKKAVTRAVNRERMRRFYRRQVMRPIMFNGRRYDNVQVAAAATGTRVMAIYKRINRKDKDTYYIE